MDHLPQLRLAVVHFPPIELYPPTLNLARNVAESGSIKAQIHTTCDHTGRAEFSCTCSWIYRTLSPVGRNPVWRMLAYLWFYGSTLMRLLKQQPNAVIYMEPSSALPVFLYSLLNPKVPVFIHHHEYHTPDQFYRPGMRLIRWFHWLEKRRLFQRACWVSHTNRKRLELFGMDCPMVPESVRRVLPNYPPAAWKNAVNHVWDSGDGPFRFVYVGSLSLSATFLEEFVIWLNSMPLGSVCFDVYAHNLDAATTKFLITNQGGVLRFFPLGLNYDQLPMVLGQYHAGVILYRAETANFRYNETNKLFEYLVCGLDVWYSERMKGVKPHARRDARPRVIECDFATMRLRDWSEFLTRPSTLRFEPEDRDAESASADLMAALRNLAS